MGPGGLRDEHRASRANGSSRTSRRLEKKVIATALKHGIAPRAEIESPDQAKYYMDLGVKHFCISTDVMLLYRSWREKGEALRKVIEG